MLVGLLSPRYLEQIHKQMLRWGSPAFRNGSCTFPHSDVSLRLSLLVCVLHCGLTSTEKMSTSVGVGML